MAINKQIKEVILSNERKAVEDFLASYSLRLEKAVDRTLYIEHNDKIIATVSSSGGIIKCLATDINYRHENLAAYILSEAIKRMHADGIYHYMVFTKAEYIEVFEGLGFKLLAKTELTAFLEYGEGDIEDTIKRLKTKIGYDLGLSFSVNEDIACVVINGNPFTNGHLHLVESAAQKHSFVVVFIVEEDGSYFSFKERIALAYLALTRLKNVVVLPSTKYIVSRATFPSYFLKTEQQMTSENAKLDALIFKNHFMPKLSIKKRFVGSETSGYMVAYNNALSEVLGDRLEILARIEDSGEVISASTVRQLIDKNDIDGALRFIPTECASVFRAIATEKASDILAARERRQNQIQTLSSDKSVVTVRTNVAGKKKRITESYLLTSYFSRQILSEFEGELRLIEDADGVTALITTDAVAFDLKKRAIEIEQDHELGRLMDIDVYDKDGSLSRGTLRQCLLCQNNAAVCIKKGEHSLDELTKAFIDRTRAYFSGLIAHALKTAMKRELDLHPKFGLVTPHTNGSHTDLSYDTMLRAQDAIIAKIVMMFWEGVKEDDLSLLYTGIKKIGLEAEADMLKSTNGANAYKGLIYILGLLTAACGHCFARGKTKVFDTVRHMAKDAIAEFDQAPPSFGVNAFKQYGITGVRGNAQGGFNIVKDAAKMIEEGKRDLAILAYIVGCIDDTVLLKRSKNMESYIYFRNLISNADEKTAGAITEQCENNNISIGGSADVLCAAIYMYIIRQSWILQ